MFERVNRYLPAAWLAWILLAATKRLIRLFPPPDAQLNGDAYWTYLPNARKLLEHPWAFLTSSPESYHVAPLGYMWAAVWGAIPERIQLANCALFLICVLLMWRCASKLGGTLAGIVATGLMVYHPQMATYIPQVLTESIYLFGLMLVLCLRSKHQIIEPAARATDARMVSALLLHTKGLGFSL